MWVISVLIWLVISLIGARVLFSDSWLGTIWPLIVGGVMAALRVSWDRLRL
jgi:hypothetical protein